MDNPILNRAEIDLALSRIPSTFEKLVFLANLVETRRSHAEFASESDGSVNYAHHELFFDWVRLGPTRQTEEIAQYFQRQGGGRNSQIGGLLDEWVRRETYRKLIPDAASDQARSLFCSDLKAILRLLRIRLGFPDGVSYQ